MTNTSNSSASSFVSRYADSHPGATAGQVLDAARSAGVISAPSGYTPASGGGIQNIQTGQILGGSVGTSSSSSGSSSGSSLGGTYNPSTGIYTSSSGVQQSMAKAPTGATIIGGIGTTYTGGGTGIGGGGGSGGSGGGGTYNPSTGTYTSSSGLQQSAAKAPAGATIVGGTGTTYTGGGTGIGGGSGSFNQASSVETTKSGEYIPGKGFVTNTGQTYPTTNPNFVLPGYSSKIGTGVTYVSGEKVIAPDGSSYIGNAIVPNTGGKTANQITSELQRSISEQLEITPSEYNRGGYAKMGIPAYQEVQQDSQVQQQQSQQSQPTADFYDIYGQGYSGSPNKQQLMTSKDLANATLYKGAQTGENIYLNKDIKLDDYTYAHEYGHYEYGKLAKGLSNNMINQIKEEGKYALINKYGNLDVYEEKDFINEAFAIAQEKMWNNPQGMEEVKNNMPETYKLIIKEINKKPISGSMELGPKVIMSGNEDIRKIFTNDIGRGAIGKSASPFVPFFHEVKEVAPV